MKIKANSLENLIKKKFTKRHVNKKISDIVSNALVWASLRGIDSHGIRLLPQYLKEIDSGIINTKPNITKKITARSFIRVNADHTFGHYAGTVGMKEAIKIAKKNGVGCCSVFNSGHCGAMSYFGHDYSKNGFITISMTHASPRILLPNTRSVFFGNNPISFTAPISKKNIFCYDSASTQTTFNEIKNKQMKKQKLSKGDALNIHGKETLNANEAKFLQAIGGYKGIGLSFIVDILSGCLSGMNMGNKITKMYETNEKKRRKLGHFFIAIDIEQVYNVKKFMRDMQLIVKRIHSQKKTNKNYLDPMIPGEPELHKLKKRLKTGIPIDKDMYSFLRNEDDV